MAWPMEKIRCIHKHLNGSARTMCTHNAPRTLEVTCDFACSKCMQNLGGAGAVIVHLIYILPRPQNTHAHTELNTI